MASHSSSSSILDSILVLDQEPETVSIVKEWQLSREARTYMNGLVKRKKRVQFGLLEHPSFVSPILRKAPVHTAKIFLYGKGGVGKTSTVCKLAGLPVPSSHHETLGIQTTLVYWPIKTEPSDSSPVELMQLELWDSGERAMRKFEHIFPSCLSSTNAIAFFFSYNDRQSWVELPEIITQAAATNRTESHLKIVIATKSDTPHQVVEPEEVERFQKEYDIKVLSLSNTLVNSDGRFDGQRELSDICNVLNELSEMIINHEKRLSLLQQQQTVRKQLQDIEISDI
ncbi:PREDICTED: REM2- and Rab-like small GTPase 1 [Amphimedon queenslandica]|uniref:Ciliogenesis and planar polarity effector 2 n=1 Tax=Amphimedon queenslandica TaxID=400682 RepID=A0AAN0IBR4_AMPQE|nr:PREDICTED: REM2- and Rab-like small GTPase 1 [Amphimedon queenslandica]|eukprot:XP_003384712.1 PREDICTED: REM2- and Rab-like small GTPase 1 [Amphimedon queenslandica]